MPKKIQVRVLSTQSKFLLTGGIIAGLAAVWHLLCLIGGVSWLVFARAPMEVVEAYRQGTWLAPVATFVVAGLMFTCTVYAFSGSGVIKKIPLLKTALVTISIICFLRAFLVLPRLVRESFTDTWQIVASSVFFFVGICFLLGSIEAFRQPALEK